LCSFFLSSTALILDIVLAIRDNFLGNRLGNTLHLAGTVPFRVSPLILTAEDSCKCYVMCSLCFDLSVVIDSINGNSIQYDVRDWLLKLKLRMLSPSDLL